MPLFNLLDITKMNEADSTVGLIEESVLTHPEITAIQARPIPGINYETLVRTALPEGDSFIDANDGVDDSKSSYENRLVETFTMQRRWSAIRTVADRYIDGPEALLAMDGIGQMKKAFMDLSTQFYYGRTLASGKGHPGLLQQYNAAANTVDALGTTEDTCTSVWFVCTGPQAVKWVMGMNGSMTPTAVRIGDVTGKNGKPAEAYIQSLTAYPGLQVGSINDNVRIKKITADSGHTLTDKLINAALAKFPAGVSPSVVFMTRRSAVQLADSRTATSTTGAPAPVPTNIVGLSGELIPIKLTDSISNTEKLAW